MKFVYFSVGVEVVGRHSQPRLLSIICLNRLGEEWILISVRLEYLYSNIHYTVDDSVGKYAKKGDMCQLLR